VSYLWQFHVGGTLAYRRSDQRDRGVCAADRKVCKLSVRYNCFLKWASYEAFEKKGSYFPKMNIFQTWCQIKKRSGSLPSRQLGVSNLIFFCPSSISRFWADGLVDQQNIFTKFYFCNVLVTNWRCICISRVWYANDSFISLHICIYDLIGSRLIVTIG